MAEQIMGDREMDTSAPTIAIVAPVDGSMLMNWLMAKALEVITMQTEILREVTPMVPNRQMLSEKAYQVVEQLFVFRGYLLAIRDMTAKMTEIILTESKAKQN